MEEEKVKGVADAMTMWLQQRGYLKLNEKIAFFIVEAIPPLDAEQLEKCASVNPLAATDPVPNKSKLN